jgi:hypothetical protein
LAIAPSPEDLIVAKMSRLEDKDRSYIETFNEARGLDIDRVKKMFRQVGHGPEKVAQVDAFLDHLPRKDMKPRPRRNIEVPRHPEGTHAAFMSDNGYRVTIRELDEETGLYIKRGNILGPAYAGNGAVAYCIGGELMSEQRWREHPDVLAASGIAQTVPGR